MVWDGTREALLQVTQNEDLMELVSLKSSEFQSIESIEIHSLLILLL